MVTPKQPRKRGLDAAIEAADAGVLARLVLDLSKLSDENRAFVEARLRTSPDPLQPYKKRIDNALYPDVFSRQPIRIGAARRAVTEYRKAVGDLCGFRSIPATDSD